MTREEFDKIKEQIFSSDKEAELQGLGLLLSANDFDSLRYEIAEEPIAFWQFRHFGEMCNYIENIYIPQENKSMSNYARCELKKYFVQFVENHLS